VGAGAGLSILADAQRSILGYLTVYYSEIRPHQNNGGLPPNNEEEIYWKSSKSAANIT
jgi:putative transposase